MLFTHGFVQNAKGTDNEEAVGPFCFPWRGEWPKLLWPTILQTPGDARAIPLAEPFSLQGVKEWTPPRGRVRARILLGD